MSKRYIDADALRKELEEIIATAEEKLKGVTEGNIACRLIYTTQLQERDNLLGLVNWTPTADVAEVKHGEWIVHPHCYECSICEFEYELDVSAFEYLPTDCCLYFCPCCGAKMDGERKEQ